MQKGCLRPRGPGGSNGHATATARVIYGADGLAPGVRFVHFMTNRDFFFGKYLNSHSDKPPADDPIRLFNHSWIADYQPGCEDVLRRVDYAIDENDVIMCVGVNNGKKTHVPAMLSSAHNVIAVGTAGGGGNSSGGYTRHEVAGRCKPDIVGPDRQTSFTTAMVTACAATLIEAANARTKDAPDAARSEVIKAAMLAGALKPDGWAPQQGRPLDEHLGAGMVNVDQSLRILDGGPVVREAKQKNVDVSENNEAENTNADKSKAPAIKGDDEQQSVELVPVLTPRGWVFEQIESGKRHRYCFDLKEPAKQVSLVLTWHRRIDPLMVTNMRTQEKLWQGLPRTADLNLRLQALDENDKVLFIEQSVSKVDNVEHIFRRDLPAGRYRIEIWRMRDNHEDAWDYSFAWRTDP